MRVGLVGCESGGSVERGETVCEVDSCVSEAQAVIGCLSGAGPA